MGESLHDDFRQVHYSWEKNNNESFTDNSKQKKFDVQLLSQEGAH